MVSKKKIKTVKEVKEKMEKYPVIGILNMHKLPARQLHQIREKLRGKAVIKMVKKRLIKIILKEAKKKGLSGLEAYIEGEPAFLFSSENPFKLARIIEESKSEAPAKPGDIAPNDIVVRAGPTNLAPGPVIGELQKVKIPAGVEAEKIVVKEDTVVAKEGDEISKELADVLSKLGINPMNLGLNLAAAWENGTIYTKDILFIPKDAYLDALKSCASQGFNLSININYFTPENISILISKAYNEALSLSLEAGIPTQENIAQMLACASAHAAALKEKIK